jgi:hypothetical protein
MDTAEQHAQQFLTSNNYDTVLLVIARNLLADSGDEGASTDSNHDTMLKFKNLAIDKLLNVFSNH